MRKIMLGSSIALVNILIPVIWMISSILIFSLTFKRMIYNEK